MMAAITAKEDFLTFAEVSQEADYYDDWLFTSTKRYHHVSMYEVEKSIHGAHWYGNQAQYICLGTCETASNDILVYKLPDLVGNEVDSLNKDRELSVLAAASCNGPCQSIVSAPITFKDSNVVARTEFHSSKVFLHSTPADFDESTITPIAPLHTFALFGESDQPPVVCLSSISLLTCSNDLRSVRWCDVITQQQLNIVNFSDAVLADSVSSVVPHRDGNDTILCGSRSGQVIGVDKRTPNSHLTIAPTLEDRTKLWSMGAKSEEEIILINDNNEIYVFDVRKPGIAALRSTLEAPPWTGRKHANDLLSQIYNDYLSISGKDNKIRIYRISNLTEESTLKPIFTHDGHLPDVQGGEFPHITTHSWNTSGSPRLLSASNTGQLHTWMFFESNG